VTAAVTGFGLSTVQVDTTRHPSPWQHLEEGQQQQGLLQEKILVVAVERATGLTVVGKPMVQQQQVQQVQQGLQQQQVQQVQQVQQGLQQQHRQQHVQQQEVQQQQQVQQQRQQ